MSDTVVGLQNQLNLLHGFCEETGLTVNTNKTKIMVFKNGGRLSRHENWTYDGKHIDVVSKFTYVGVTFTSKLSTNIMAADQSVKAKRALIAVMNSLYKCGQLPSSIFFKLFDTKIKPILLYGSELWGYSKRDTTEIVQRYACRRFLCVNQKSCVAPVMAECERFPIYIDTSVRTLKYWLKILHMPEYRLVKKCYNMLKLFDENGKTNWVSHNRTILLSSGFGISRIFNQYFRVRTPMST